VYGFLFQFRNISKEKIALENQNSAESIIAKSPSVVFRWLPDEEWTVLYVSSNVKEVLGYTSIELAGANNKFVVYIHPEDLINIRLNANAALAKGDEILTLEYRVKHKNGDYIWVEEQAYLRYDQFGVIQFYESILTNINRRKEAEFLLKESQLKTELAFNAIQAGVWDWLDVKKDLQWWSEKFYTIINYTPEELQPGSNNFLQIIHKQDQQTLKAALIKHFTDHVPFALKLRIKPQHLPYKLVLLSGSSIRNQEGKVTRMVGSLVNIND